MPLRRRDLLKLSGAAALLGPGCASTPLPRPTLAPGPRHDAFNRVMLASPGNLDAVGEVDGVIPDALRGARYVLNGPGRLTYGGRMAHPFDGHGYLRQFTFTDDGGVALKARFIETPVFKAEEQAQRLLAPGIGTLPDEGPLPADLVRNVANTTVVPWGDHLLAGFEGGSPFKVEQGDLSTVGEERFGVLGDGATLAHMRLDTAQDRLVLLSPTMGMNTGLHFREIDREGRVANEVTVETDGFTFAHDFVITPSFYILAKNPLNVSLLGFAKAQLGMSTLIEAIEADLDPPGALLVIPRDRSGVIFEVVLGAPAFVVHFLNAFEARGELTVDLCAMPDFIFGEEFGFRGAHASLDPALPDQRRPQRAIRARVPIAPSGDVGAFAVTQGLATHAIDFPRVALADEGRNARLGVAATRADIRYSDPFDAIASLDLDDLERDEAVWAPGGDRFMGEPVLYPHDDGSMHAVAMVYDGSAGHSTLCVFDAKEVARGPVASVRFPLLPYGFHGSPLPRTA
jgi:all-trans-8'-apo-beta-carotenal 15,15'-oxygenase